MGTVRNFCADYGRIALFAAEHFLICSVLVDFLAELYHAVGVADKDDALKTVVVEVVLLVIASLIVSELNCTELLVRLLAVCAECEDTRVHRIDDQCASESLVLKSFA